MICYFIALGFCVNKYYVEPKNIKKNQIIGSDGSEIIKAKRNSIIVFAHNRIKKGEEGLQ